MRDAVQENVQQNQDPDPEPQPTDGPDFHMDHAFWLARQVVSE